MSMHEANINPTEGEINLNHPKSSFVKLKIGGS